MIYQNYLDEEPMDVDSSLIAGATPIHNRVQSAQQQQQQLTDDITSPSVSGDNANMSNHKARPKIVKSIKPSGGRIIKPPASQNDNNNEIDNDDPFKSSSSSSSSAFSINGNLNFNDDENPFQTKRTLARSPSPTKINPNDNPFQTRQTLPRSPSPNRSNNFGNAGSLTNSSTTNDSNNDLNDEWETHKKRSTNTNRKSSDNSNNNSNSNNEQNTNNHSNSPTSCVSSTTDVSSVSSNVSPHQQPQQEQQQPEQQQSDDPFNTPVKQPQMRSVTTRLSCSSNDALTDQLTNDNQNNLLVDLNDDTLNNTNFNNTINMGTDTILFDSIFSNESEFQSFLDLLEKKEKDSIKKSPKYSEFARKSLYLQFDPIVQSRSLSPDKIKRLSLIKEKQEEIKFFLSGIAEENDESKIISVQERIKEEEEEEETNRINNNKNCIIDEEEVAKQKQQETNPEQIVDIDNENRKISEEIMTMNTGSAESLNQQEHLVANTVDNNNEHKLLLNGDVNTENNNLNEPVNSDFLDANNTTDEHINLVNVNVQNQSNRKSSISSSVNNSFDQHLKAHDTTNGNSSILDIDKLSISHSQKNHHQLHNDSDSFKLLNDDSMLDDLLGKNDSKIISNKITTKPALVKATPAAKTIPDKKILNNNNTVLSASVSTATSVTAISDDDLSTASSATNTSNNQTISSLINELNLMKEKEKEHLSQIQMLEEENEKFKTVAIEFERIFHNLIKDKDESESKLKNEIIELTKERDHLQEDVIGVERAFDDLHRRFEKLKTKVEEFKKNEETLQKAIESYKLQLEKEKLKYSTLKKHAEEKLELANSEIDKLRKTTSIELQTLKAELRKAEIKISSLELSVQQKDQENTQLTNLLEDLLNKVKPT